MGDRFNKFKILIGVRDAEKRQEIQAIERSCSSYPPCRVRRAQPAYPDRNNTLFSENGSQIGRNKVVSFERKCRIQANSLSSW